MKSHFCRPTVSCIVNGLQLEITLGCNTALLQIQFFMGSLVCHGYKKLGARISLRWEPVNSPVHWYIIDVKNYGLACIKVNRKTNQSNLPPFHSSYRSRHAPTIPNQSLFTMISCKSSMIVLAPLQVLLENNLPDSVLWWVHQQDAFLGLLSSFLLLMVTCSFLLCHPGSLGYCTHKSSTIHL